MIWLAITTALAGGIGAAVRFGLDGVVTAHSRYRIPLGTPVINVTGSLLLGFVTGLATDGASAEVRTIVGVGFLGGYTTFSTASTQNSDLVRKGHPFLAIVYGAGMLAGSLLAAGFGLWIGMALT